MTRARLLWLIPVVAGAAVVALLLRGGDEEPVADRFFGVVPNDELSNGDLRRLVRGGVSHVRFLLSWPNVQPASDAKPDWVDTDARVRGLAENGIEPVPFVYGTPSFAATDPRSPPLATEAATRAYEAFLRAAVQRYGPGGDFWEENPDVPREPVRVWQIWNEQNSLKFFAPKPSPRQYAKLIEISHEAITAVDPGAELLLGGMFGTPSSSRESIPSWRFLGRMYQVEGIESRFDAIGINPFSPDVDGIRTQFRLLREQAREAGDPDVRLWVSEIGWGSKGSGSDLIKSRRGQARMLERAFELFVEKREDWNLDRVTWYTWRDGGGDCIWCPYAGLIDRDGRGKPAWRAFQSFAR